VFEKSDKLLLADKAEKGRFSGVVQISNESGIIFQNAYDYANRAWLPPYEIHRRFRISSIGKMFTAVAVFIIIRELI
jgi:CubicO group peptidase (beta-lactamase class C family)